MESLRRFCLREAESAIRETRRFGSAPADDRAGATSNIVGVEAREFRGIASRATRPALVVQCRCGPFVGRFSLGAAIAARAMEASGPVRVLSGRKGSLDVNK